MHDRRNRIGFDRHLGGNRINVESVANNDAAEVEGLATAGVTITIESGAPLYGPAR